MTPRHLLMGAALVGAAALVLFGDKTPATEVAQPVVRAARPAAEAARTVAAPAARTAAEPAIARLLPRALLVGEPGDMTGTADGVFGTQDWNPPPPPVSNAAPPPPPPPSAPPLPFTYLGKAASDGKWEVYLARADKTYVVTASMVIDGTYRVDAIAPPMLTLTYLPLNQVQTLNIGVLD